MKNETQSSKYLSDWLRERKIPKGEFARKMGISKPSMSRIIQGRQLPTIDLATKIELETRGFVSVKGWVTPLQLEAAE